MLHWRCHIIQILSGVVLNDLLTSICIILGWIENRKLNVTSSALQDTMRQ